jgi:hypothetical protein
MGRSLRRLGQGHAELPFRGLLIVSRLLGSDESDRRRPASLRVGAVFRTASSSSLAPSMEIDATSGEFEAVGLATQTARLEWPIDSGQNRGY